MTLVDPSTTENLVVDHVSPTSAPSAVPPVGTPSAEVLRLIEELTRHREVMTSHWSDDTIYPGFRATKTDDQPESHGQCGVSSAWLLRRMTRSWRSQARYCVGDVYFTAGERSVEKFHCWVEIGDESSPERLVIDLTSDQFKAFNGESLVCEEHGRLISRSIEYRASSRRAFKQLRGDSVWGRFKVLDRSMKPTPLQKLRKVLPVGTHRGQSDVIVPGEGRVADAQAA
ncbi:hypothetical protein [Kribbella sp. NPDC055071]